MMEDGVGVAQYYSKSLRAVYEKTVHLIGPCYTVTCVILIKLLL